MLPIPLGSFTLACQIRMGKRVVEGRGGSWGGREESPNSVSKAEKETYKVGEECLMPCLDSLLLSINASLRPCTPTSAE